MSPPVRVEEVREGEHAFVIESAEGWPVAEEAWEAFTDLITGRDDPEPEPPGAHEPQH